MKRIIEWFRRRREWRKDHRRTWSGMDLPGPSGLTPFQERCEAALTERLDRLGIALVGRTIEDEVYVTARLGETPWSIDICEDQVQLSGPKNGGVNLEAWDARTPDELIAMFLTYVERALQEE